MKTTVKELIDFLKQFPADAEMQILREEKSAWVPDYYNEVLSLDELHFSPETNIVEILP